MSAESQTHPENPPVATGPGVVSTGWLAANSMFGETDRHRGRTFNATLTSLALHLGVFALLLFAYTVGQQVMDPTNPMEITHVVFLEQPGPGGGGGGSPAPAPPKPIEIPKPVPATPIPITPPPVVPPPPPDPTLTAPITTNSSVVQATGANSVSLAAYGGGGSGGGIGTGRGNGVGEGTGGGFGGGAYEPGNGISNPEPLLQPEPKYTSEAMRAKIQGEVWLEAVVTPGGTINEVRVVKSLDRLFGLDEEAMKAAKRWLFRPGKDRTGKAVPVKVTLILEFRLH